MSMSMCKLDSQPLTLCLDLATSTGWALCSSTELVASGTIAFPTPKNGDVYDAVVKFDAWLNQLDIDYPIRDMVWERVDFCSFASAFATHHRLLTTAVWWAKEKRIPYMGIPLSTHREHAGCKSGDKIGAMEYARRRFNAPITTDDQADACCMAAYVIDGGLMELPTQLEEAKAKKKAKTDAKRTKTLEAKKANALHEQAKLAAFA